MKRSPRARAVAAALAAIVASQATAGPQEDLNACGAIADSAERLACYDRLAGRTTLPGPAPPEPATAASPPVASPAATSAVAAPTTAPFLPAPVTMPAAPAAPVPVSTASQAQPAAAAKPAAPAADAKSFGSYPAEHPAAPALADTLRARVAAMGKTIDGRPTVTLEGGALWLLDEVDPLLAVGDTVTVSRGALHSFLLETPTGRQHHVRRIR